MMLIHGSCPEALSAVETGSADLILTDPPYGSTACVWDSKPELTAMFAEFWRILSDTGAIVITCQQPFTTDLINAAREYFKYSLVWQKSRPGGFVSAGVRPLVAHEDILVFSKASAAPGAKKNMFYFPQGVKWGEQKRVRKSALGVGRDRASQQGEYTSKGSNYPRSVLEFSSEGRTVHPTQKPVDLMRYLIRTYCPEKGVIVDPYMGSGTTGVAAHLEARNFIGIELDEKYFNIASERISKVISESDDKCSEGEQV